MSDERAFSRGGPAASMTHIERRTSGRSQKAAVPFSCRNCRPLHLLKHRRLTLRLCRPSIPSAPRSDIRSFLEVGVPPDLTRAALRRVWSTDLAIRNFVGLSENSWDFNAPDAIPGFGAIDAESATHMVARILGQPDAIATEKESLLKVARENGDTLGAPAA